MIQQEQKKLDVRQLGGLSIERDRLDRQPNTWAELTNFDLFTSGSIRKVNGYTSLVDHLFDSQITAIFNYRRTPGDPLLTLGISELGSVYNLETGEYLANFPNVNIPFVGQMPGITDGATDPDAYDPGTTVQWVIATTGGFYPYKWDGSATPPSIIGVTPPPSQPIIKALILAQNNTLTDALPYMNVIVQRRYAWTYWNPATKHESSLSPMGDGDVIDANKYQWINQYFPRIRAVALAVPTTPPERGEGYTRKRIYATRDGSENFFLLENLIVDAIDADHSIPLEYETVWDGYINPSDVTLQAPTGGSATDDPGYFVARMDLTDADVVALRTEALGQESIAGAFPNGSTYVPNGPVGTYLQSLGVGLTPQAVSTDLAINDDSTLIQPSPLVGENDPPPPAIWGAIYQGRVWLVDSQNPARLVFSKTREFQSYPVDNEILIPSDDYDPITALVGQYQQLVIGKKRSCGYIQGTDFTNFILAPLDPQVGFAGRRSVVEIEGRLMFLSRQGIEIFSSDLPQFVGKEIRPLTDTIVEAMKLERICTAFDSRQGIAFFTHIEQTPQHEGVFRHRLIAMDISEQQPFSVVDYFPEEVTAMAEVELSNGDIAILFAMGCHVYRLFDGVFGGLGVVQASLETQPLPQTEIDNRKVFRRLKCEGAVQDLAGFRYYYAIDQQSFQGPFQLQVNNPLGVVGKQIVIRLKHDGVPVPLTRRVQLSNLTIEYVDLGGESRSQ